MGRAASAEIAIQFEMAEFERALQKYIEAYPQNLVQAVKTVAFDLERGIKKRTPVDTGRLRSSFHTVVPGKTDNFSYAVKGKTYDGALSEKPADPSTGVIEAIVGTNTEYAGIIESGTSLQAPQGMVRVSIAELRGKLERAVRFATERPDLALRPEDSSVGVRDVESPVIF